MSATALTPHEMAVIIDDEHDCDQETAEAFILRKFRHEKAATVFEALSILIERERIRDEFAAFMEALRADDDQGAATLSDLVALRRKQGYNPELETILARRWRCPHCKCSTSIFTGVLMPIGNPKRMPACAACGEEGIAPVEAGAPDLSTIDGGKGRPKFGCKIKRER